MLVSAADGEVDDAEIGDDEAGVVARVTLDIDHPLPAGRDFVLWARVAGGDAVRSSPGDWITVQSVPVRPATDTLDVPVRRIV